MDKDQERKLIEDVLGGRLEAFDVLVRQYQRAVYGMALKLLRNPEEADEITQQVFVKAYTHLKQFRFEASFKTWITQIAINLIRNQWKRLKKIFVEFDENKARAEVRGEETEKGEKQKWLKESLGRLPSTQREVLMLRVYEEKSFQEIAEILNSKEGTVKVNFHYALKQLKEWVGRKKEQIL